MNGYTIHFCKINAICHCLIYRYPIKLISNCMDKFYFKVYDMNDSDHRCGPTRGVLIGTEERGGYGEEITANHQVRSLNLSPILTVNAKPFSIFWV